LAFLLAANRAIHDVVDALVREEQFSAVTAQLAELAQQSLGAQYLELWAATGETLLQFEQGDGFAGHRADPPADVQGVLRGEPAPDSARLILALTSPASNQIDGAVVLGFRERPNLGKPAIAVVGQIAGLVEVGLEREVLRRSADLERAAWHDRAIHDPLTGLYNRVLLSDSARRMFALDDRNETAQVAALMIDIDLFKRVNDTYGHPTGDRVLQHVAQAITQSVRPSDLVFRFGGEEFLVLLPDVDEATAIAAAERIRTRVAHPSEECPDVTVSVGVAHRHEGEDHEDLVARADLALYQAKSNGRNRVEVAP
jgi:diguanylate cyclase